MNNRILNFALILLKVVMGLVVLVLLGGTGVAIHLLFSPESYSQVVAENAFQTGFGLGNFKFCPECAHDGSRIFLGELSQGMILWLFVRLLVFGGLVLAILVRIGKIFNSVKSARTFYDENIRHFRILGRLSLAIFLFSSFNFVSWRGETGFHFTLAFGPLFFGVGCMVLAEVFREGKLLLEDNASII
ncbi:MAG: DUF2975 domain-containing protein [Bacteroidia bacterium]|nr:DUF2975 domain-containing protein [Bacteroidia bacterium]